MLSYQFTFPKTAEPVGPVASAHLVRTIGFIECRAYLVPNKVRDGYWQVGRIDLRDTAGKWFELAQRDPLHEELSRYAHGPDHQHACDDIWFAQHPMPRARAASVRGQLEAVR